MKKSGILILMVLVFGMGYSQASNDSFAIMHLLEKESMTWRSGDLKGHADCWKIMPYSRIFVSLPDGKAIDVPPILMVNPPANMLGKGGYAVNSNIKMSVIGNQAWVSHDELSTGADGSKSYSYEMRILEKSDGEWKLVGQSIHVYKPEEGN